MYVIQYKHPNISKQLVLVGGNIGHQIVPCIDLMLSTDFKSGVLSGA